MVISIFVGAGSELSHGVAGAPKAPAALLLFFALFNSVELDTAWSVPKAPTESRFFGRVVAAAGARACSSPFRICCGSADHCCGAGRARGHTSYRGDAG